MQNTLFVEYLLGKPWKKYPGVKTMYDRIVRAVHYLTIIPDAAGHKIDFDFKSASMAGIDSENVMYMMQDPGFSNLLVGLSHYVKRPKNYIFSPYLTSLLQGTSNDLECQFLHKECSGYMELPGLLDRDGDKVLGILFKIANTTEWNIQIVWILEHKNSGYINSFFYERIESGTISEIVAKTKRTESYVTDGEYNLVTTPPKEWDEGSLELTTINAILWVMHKEDLLEKLNEFAQKKSKKEVQEKIYTRLPYVPCDMERQYTVTTAFTRGHTKFVRVGKGRTKLRFKYILPYPRDLKK